MNSDPSGLAFLLVAVVVLVAAAAQMVSGFGFALMAVPLCGTFIDLKTAVVVCTICGTASNTFQAVTDRKQCDGSLAARLVVASLVGMPIGWLLLEHASSDQLRVSVGVAVLLALLLLRFVRLPDSKRLIVDSVAGFVSGALAIATSTNGPPLVLIMRARQLRPEVFRATINRVFSIIAIVSIVIFVASGRVTSDVLRASVISLPGLAIGITVGSRLRTKLSDVFFWRLVLAMLVASAGASIATGVF